MTNSDRAAAFRRTRRALDAVNALAQVQEQSAFATVAELPIFGDKAKNAQTYGACLARLLSIPPALTTRLQFQQVSKPI